MTSLASFLPAPKQTKKPVKPIASNDNLNVSNNASQRSSTTSSIPPYGQRKGWVPREPEDFGDGGAFPEIHVAQYPLNMGRKKKAAASAHSKVVALTTDGAGNPEFDVIIGSNDKYVQSRHSQLVPAQHLIEPKALERPDDDALALNAERTRKALEAKLHGKTAAAAPIAAAEAAARTHGGEATFVRYTPVSVDNNSKGQTRIVKMVTAPVDPLEPPKFRHKKVTKGEGEAPVPVMHSPPRKVTAEDQQAWKIPPCISNWKNMRGYTIPLDKRLAADGRGLQEVTINDNFAKLAESLYVAESSAREEVSKRAAIQRKLAMNEKETNEEMLRRLAAEARLKRAGGGAAAAGRAEEEEEEQSVSPRRRRRQDDSDSDDDTRRAPRTAGGEMSATDREKEERDRIRAERRRERERQLRMESMGNRKNKLTRDEDRDISERVALGMQAAATSSKETQYDQRLFNQTAGMSSGFGPDDAYNAYDQPLFKRGEAANKIYRPKAVADDADAAANADAEYSNLLKGAAKFRPAKGFAGAEGGESAGPRDGPVQFEKEKESDPFGLDSFLQSAKDGKRRRDDSPDERKRSRR